jgi:hypothetical protein
VRINLNISLLYVILFFLQLGFYSLLALVKVYVMVGQFENAIDALSNINFKYLIVYSRSGGAY